MATTTSATQRDLMVTTVKALTPSSLGQVAFIHHDQRTDFRSWCEANKTGAFRKFSIKYLGPVAGIGVNDTTQVWVQDQFECVIAYPNDYRYGAQMMLDQDDVLRQDLHRVKDSLGARAYGTFGDAAVIEELESVEQGVEVTFAVLTLTLGFWRATP